MRVDGKNGFSEGHGGDIACPHRNVSCCDECLSQSPSLAEVYGQVFLCDDAEWALIIADGEREGLRRGGWAKA